MLPLSFARLVLVLFLLGLAPAARAETDLRLQAEFQAIHAEALLRTMDLALLGAADVLGRSQTQNELIIHEAFGNYVKRAPGLRAIIATNSQGELQFDSFKFPAQRLDLSNRDYIKVALEMKNRDAYLGKPLMGKTSDVAFLPMSMPIFDIFKRVIGVVAGIMTPNRLIRQNILCKACFVSIYREDGEKITSYPSSLQFPEDMLTLIKTKSQNGILEHQMGSLEAQSSSARIQDYKLWIVFTKLKLGS